MFLTSEEIDTSAMTELNHRAVLTGDIIRSSRLSPAQLASVRSSLTAAVAAVKRWKRGLVSGKLEFYRGDGWQLLLTDPALAMRAAVFLRASLLAQGLADTRVSIGVGEVRNTRSRRTSLSTGQAFVLSGHGLDEMAQHSRMTFEIPESAGPLSAWPRVVSHLCDALMGRWTRRQAELICAAVVPEEPGAETVAQSLHPPISKQAVAKALKSANWYVLREAIHHFEQASWPALPRPTQQRKTT
ncbi:hypothetical protein [uncultured Paludibaculum sp.]|uniref:hypothetical protein n=1 Tax=uncultured Paludibaculum sp. TaxID=1765020 RepID=UPI002AAC37B4|nr:hypothetical protein [uncultured Paludibaculum sp.]